MIEAEMRDELFVRYAVVWRLEICILCRVCLDS